MVVESAEPQSDQEEEIVETSVVSREIIKNNRLQQRNGPIIHDVTSVKYSRIWKL